jgi:hypothetical protein
MLLAGNFRPDALLHGRRKESGFRRYSPSRCSYPGARSPSGKAWVCKTHIGGSIPPRASKLGRLGQPSSDGFDHREYSGWALTCWQAARCDHTRQDKTEIAGLFLHDAGLHWDFRMRATQKNLPWANGYKRSRAFGVGEGGVPVSYYHQRANSLCLATHSI